MRRHLRTAPAGQTKARSATPPRQAPSRAPHAGSSGPRLSRTVVVLLLVPVSLIVVFAARRVFIDVHALVSGTLPDSPTDIGFAQHPILTYAHIVASLVYLFGTPLQLSRRFRTASYARHRRLGRAAVGCAGFGTVFAVVYGLHSAVGGTSEAAASALFGTYLLSCLALAIHAVRRGDIPTHRRWMIRAFVIAIAVGTVRLLVLALWGSGLTSIQTAFGGAFWLAFALHLLAGELWLRRHPGPPRGNDVTAGSWDRSEDRSQREQFRTTRNPTGMKEPR